MFSLHILRLLHCFLLDQTNRRAEKEKMFGRFASARRFAAEGVACVNRLHQGRFNPFARLPLFVLPAVVGITAQDEEKSGELTEALRESSSAAIFQSIDRSESKLSPGLGDMYTAVSSYFASFGSPLSSSSSTCVDLDFD